MESIDSYRDRARTWLAEHAPRADIEADLEAGRDFQARLHAAGFAGITWPAEYGGQGLTAEHERVFRDEAKRYPLPAVPFAIGIGMAGPVLMDLGTEDQRRRYLTPILRGAEIWCQLFSEPGAGSDVASLQTRAVRDDGGWVVNGQKVWASRAHFAERGILVARTDPERPKHSGLTMFVVDMRAVGIDVRPLRDMTGNVHFNEVYFDDVRLPPDAVIGRADEGWSAALTMLKHERVAIGTRNRSEATPLSARGLARRQGAPVPSEVRAALGRLAVEERAVALLAARMAEERAAGAELGARGSVAKLASSQLARNAADLAVSLAADRGIGFEAGDGRTAELITAINWSPASGIAGGTTEVQRNIIAERVLGLPKEPQADRDVPFNRLTVAKR
ncbi:acyl-CoA dehydrogenase family protein [Actinomadura viridis]|uniref:acyl-CoA dehydrogenase family protein n=1 Tax=Actinomadura viridis TaxID=58110 RepID=UPI0036BC3C21